MRSPLSLTDGSEPELFLFDGHGGQGAVLIATSVLRPRYHENF